VDGSTNELNALTQTVIGCAVAVHEALGPGLLESIYQDCLQIELAARRLAVERERRVVLHYKGHQVGHLKLDLLVADALVVEVKAIDQIHPVHLAQVITYLKLTEFPAGLIINFNVTSLRQGGVRRLNHPSRYTKRLSS
jgi:GxxExxY protein